VDRLVGVRSCRMVGDCLHQGLVARTASPGDTSRAATTSTQGDARWEATGSHNTSSEEASQQLHSSRWAGGGGVLRVAATFVTARRFVLSL